MNEATLPKSVLDRAERRWASRLARDALTWGSEKRRLGDQTTVTDRAGRMVQVTSKRVPKPAPRIP
jgi:hypothetical protein